MRPSIASTVHSKYIREDDDASYGIEWPDLMLDLMPDLMIDVLLEWIEVPKCRRAVPECRRGRK